MDVLSPLLRVENFPYIEHIFGIVLGSGLSSAQRDTNSSLLDSALAANGGTIYRAKRGTTLEIGKRIVVPSNAGIIGDTGKGAKFRIYCAVAKFTNTDNTTSTNLGITVGRYGPQSVAIDFSGVSYTTGAAATRTTGVRLQNFQIEFEVSSNRILRGIVGRNTEKFLIDDVEIKGLPNGIGICLASAINGKINEPHIHTSAIVGTDSTYSQLTGIEFDNDILNGYSSDIDVVHPKIHDLTASGGTVNSEGWQTDGIQIVNANTLRIKVIGGSIRNVGEGIDWYGSFGSVTGTTIENCQTKNLKLIHGASYNTFSGLTLNRGGIANLSLEGSSAANLDVRGNVFTGIVAKSVNHNGHFTANETACVLIGSGTSKNYDNIFSNCFLDGDGTAKHGWADFSSGNGNIGDGIKITNVITNRINITAGGGSVREVGSAAFVTSKSAAALVLSPITVPDDAYGAGWDGSIEVPTKNAVYDKIQTLSLAAGANTATANTWTATQTFRVDSAGGHYIVVQNRDVTGTQSAGIALVQGGVDFATGRHAEITATGGASPTINFRTSFGDPPADRFHISPAGNFYPAVGAATAMTNGFVYISAADGPPTGTPTNYAGTSPLYMDRTNNALYCYANSAWRNMTGAAPDDTAFANTWNGVTTTAPSKNAVYDMAIGQLARYHSLLDSSGSHIAGRTANTYGMGQGDPLAITGVGTLYPLNIVYLDPADYPSVGGITPKLRLRCTVMVNDVAPTGNFTIGLHPVTRPATSGGAGLNIHTIGAAVSGSGVTLTAPAADSMNNVVGTDFAMPTAGYYVIGVVSTATVAANSHLHFSAILQQRYT